MKEKIKFWDVNKIAYVICALGVIANKEFYYNKNVITTILKIICCIVPTFLAIKYILSFMKFLKSS